MSPRRAPFASVVAVLLGLALPPAAGGQPAELVRVTVPEENLRTEPRGNKLATVFEGTVLNLEEVRGDWRRVTLRGWIWRPSVDDTDRDGFDLVVSEVGGENLRAEPSGEARRAARLLQGMLLEAGEVRGNWVRVSRSAWMWGRSLSPTEGAPAPPPPDAGTDGTPPPAAPERLLVGERPVRLLVSPEGDTLAVLQPGADLRILAREGSWARVRVEGWVSVPATLPADSAADGELGAADLRANPETYVGRRVRWRVQVISLERAEPVRTDFYEGEPFLLARTPESGDAFVYLAVPPELLDAAAALEPLQQVEVLARVRTGRSALMGRPVLDLIAIR